MPRRLLIVDHYDSPAFERAAAVTAPGDEWEVFLLGGNRDWFEWRHPGHAARLAGAQFVDPAPVEGAAHELVNDFVVEMAADLPKRSLGGTSLFDLLRRPGWNGWWFLQTSEKGPYRTPLVGQLYRLALVRLVTRAAAAGEVWFSLRETALAEAIGSAIPQNPGWTMAPAATPPPPTRLESRPLLRAIVITLRAFARFAALKAFAASSATTVKGSGRGRWIFTVFPSWWSRANTPSPADRFLTDVQDGGFDGYLAWLTEPGWLWRHGAHVRTALRDRRVVALQTFTTWGDVMRLLAPARLRLLRRFEAELRPHLHLEFAGLPVGALIARDISWSLSSQEPIQDELLATALRRALGAYRPGAVVFRLEFQPIESALIVAARGTGTRMIGYHHHPFDRNYPQMFFTPRQIAESLGDQPPPDARPLPDGVIAIGPALARNLAAGGYPFDRIAVCGPQRYGPLTRYRRSLPPRRELRAKLGLPADVFLVFVALAIVEADTEALFGALVKASLAADGVRLIVRTHPNRPLGDPALQATLDTLGRERASLMPDAGSMYDNIAAADCMICIGSMIAFEAMALGVMPIVFDNAATYGSVSLASYEKGLFNVRNARELADAVHELRAEGSTAAAKRAAWPGLLARVLGDLEHPLEAQMHAALDALDQRQPRHATAG